jgi:hypothetical protein
MDYGEERGRMSFDFCIKHQKYLPTAAFCFDDVCCPNSSYFNIMAFSVLEKTAEACAQFEKK